MTHQHSVEHQRNLTAITKRTTMTTKQKTEKTQKSWERKTLGDTKAEDKSVADISK